MDMDDMDDMEMDADDEKEDDMEESVVREYTEKAPAPVTAEQGDGSAGPVAGKNDMGGKSVDPTGEEHGGTVAAPKVHDAGNKNKPGGKAGLEKA